MYTFLKSSKNGTILEFKERVEFEIEKLKIESYKNNEYIGETIESNLEPLLSKYIDNHKSFFVYLLREIIRNVPEHSDSNNCYLDIFTNTQHEIGFVVSDQGIGIMNSLSKNKLYIRIKDNFSLLSLSLKPGVTKTVVHDVSIPKEWRNSGFGLFMVSNLVKDMGRFEIKSKVDSIILRGMFMEGIKIKEIKGTCIVMVIDLDKTSEVYNKIGFYSKLGNQSIKGLSQFSEYATYDTASKASTLLPK